MIITFYSIQYYTDTTMKIRCFPKIWHKTFNPGQNYADTSQHKNFSHIAQIRTQIPPKQCRRHDFFSRCLHNILERNILMGSRVI